MTIFPFFNLFGGRATAFAIFFTIAGTILAFMGHLDASYVALIGAIQSLIVLHSAKEDYFDSKPSA